MKFVYYSNLNKDAKTAFDKGNGKHSRFAVDGYHIAGLLKDGRTIDWVAVIKCDTPDITEQVR